MGYFSYSPQAKIPAIPNTFTLNQGAKLNLTINVGGEHNQYQWLKDGTAVSSISTDPDYSKTSVAISDSGTYVCHITNTVVTDLTLYTEDITVAVESTEADTDSDGLPDAIETDWCTDPNDADTDDDGILDGTEDTNHNGVQDPGETHPCKIDTDGDGIQDGTELGITLADVGNDTNTSVFQPDLDPHSTTNPLLSDTDGDGISDGEEDPNHNGRVDSGETDPTVDDGTTYYVEPNGRCGGKNHCFDSIQAAVDAAGTGSIILIANGTYSESITLNASKILTLQGGWDLSFDTPTGTTILTTAPRALMGSLTLQELRIKP